MRSQIMVDDYSIGFGYPCFIIAEAGVNHNGDLGLAKTLIEAAKTAGADAVKFQTFSTDDLALDTAPKASYQRGTTDKAESQYQMLKKLELKQEEFADLKLYADQVGITFLSTPYDLESARYLAELGVGAIKIASIDITNHPLLKEVARLGLPILLSTGMATLGEIEQGLAVVNNGGNSQVVLLHCVTNYPIKEEEANLRVMGTLRQAFDVPVGYSDHTVGLAAPLAAVALGAVVIEKHFTLDRDSPGPDHAASIEPAGLAELVAGIRAVEQALGSGVKHLSEVEMENRRTMRRSLVAKCSISKGTLIDASMLAMKRPGTGLGGEFIPYVVGRQARRDIEYGEQIIFDLLR
jgi:N,N'-diacetyllegionaminate synthase